MAQFDGFLMRDTISDTGQVPSPGYPYSSPDLIAHAQVADPVTYFTSNYGSDPNQAVQLGSRLNPVYVRAKNLSEQPKSGYYISVFRANTSLFMRPSIWRNNALSTADGRTSVPLPATVAPGAVGVGADPFLLDAVSSNLFCCVGMVSPSATPQIPTDFQNYEAYIAWVRNNRNVCCRNLNTVRSYPNRWFERVDAFSNPSQTDSVPTLFEVTLRGTLPPGSTFGLQCAPLGIATNWNIDHGPRQVTSGITPPMFDGMVTTWAILPTNASWPPNTSIDTAVWVGFPDTSPMAQYATPLSEIGVRAEEVEGLGNGILVRLGNCQTLFVSQ
ncbi:MAG: hypothetical protein ACJ786_11430 [Catenulispora sp.]